MNNFTLTDYEEYLTGTLTKRSERVRLARSHLRFVQLGTGFELDSLVSEARTLTSALGFWADCVFDRFGDFPTGFKCTQFLLR